MLARDPQEAMAHSYGLIGQKFNKGTRVYEEAGSKTNKEQLNSPRPVGTPVHTGTWSNKGPAWRDATNTW